MDGRPALDPDAVEQHGVAQFRPRGHPAARADHDRADQVRALDRRLDVHQRPLTLGDEVRGGRPVAGDRQHVPRAGEAALRRAEVGPVGVAGVPLYGRALLDEPDAWTPALRPDGSVREGAHVAELADPPLDDGWPEGLRVLVRREPLHPGRS